LGLLRDFEICSDRGRGRGRALSRPVEERIDKPMARGTFFGMRTHHVALALIAILVAVALVSNYYLW
jgi:hypothetical protein